MCIALSTEVYESFGDRQVSCVLSMSHRHGNQAVGVPNMNNVYTTHIVTVRGIPRECYIG